MSNHVKEGYSQVPSQDIKFPSPSVKATYMLQSVYLASQVYSTLKEEVWPDSNLHL